MIRQALLWWKQELLNRASAQNPEVLRKPNRGNLVLETLSSTHSCRNSKTAMLMFHCFPRSIPVIALPKTNETALALEHWGFPCFCLLLATFARASFCPRFISTIAFHKMK